MDRKIPLVSIVTPSYNQGRFIEATLLSVKSQDYPNIEHIVIDGGSTDNTTEVLKRYEKEYNLKWTSGRDKGQSDAINKGFAKASGEIIGWLNSDDVYFDRQVVSYVVSEFSKLPDTGVVYGDGVIINKDNLVLLVWHTIPYFSFNRLLRLNVFFQPSCFFRRSVVVENKLDTNMHLSMDYEYYLKIARNGIKFKHVNRLLSGFRSYETAKSTARAKEMRIEGKKIRKLYGCDPDLSYYLLRFLDLVLVTLSLKIYGVKTMLELHMGYERANLAFSPRFDSPVRALLRQALATRLRSIFNKQ